MIRLGSRTIYFGDFHGQWNETKTNPALLLAGLTYYGYDFSVFQGTGPTTWTDGMARALHAPITFFSGRECMFDWAHITTWDLEGDPPSLDTPDFREVLDDMRGRTRMMTVAHPFIPFLPHLEGLLDDGLIDAVEIVNGGQAFLDESSPGLQWFRAMQRKGRRVPVVGGMDIHIAAALQRPAVSYSAAFPPTADFDCMDHNRTAVLVEECTPEAIVDAVRAGRSVVEAGGTLLGDPDLVRELEANGYWEARREAQERLNRLTLDAAQTADLVACRPAGLIPEPGAGDTATLRVLTGTDTADTYSWNRDTACIDICIPHTYDRNLFHLGVSMQAEDGTAKVFALRVRSPVELEWIDRVSGPGRGLAELSLVNRTDDPLRGRVCLAVRDGATVECAIEPVGPHDRMAVDGPEITPRKDPSRPLAMDARVDLAEGITRRFCRNLSFWGAAYLERDEEERWLDVPEMVLGYEDQVDPLWTHTWAGKDDCSALVKVAWNEQGLFLRARVVDDVLCASPRPAQPMFGDALQIAINPLNRNDLPAFSAYNFFFTRHLQNDRLQLDRSPKIVCAGIRRPDEQVLLPHCLFSTEALSSTETLLRARLPWHWLVPMQPVPGYRFGLYLILWDNDGSGCKASLQWPRYAEAEVGSAWYVIGDGAWAQLVLLPQRGTPDEQQPR